MRRPQKSPHDAEEIASDAADRTRGPRGRRHPRCGRGIARALAEAGATVYCTGRSVTGKPSPYRRPETINQTAALIKAAGGAAIAVRVDHTSEREVTALFRRILRTHHRLDVVVDSVAGEDPLLKQARLPLAGGSPNADAMFRQGSPRASSRRSMPRSR
jgi:NAD(P)-dependent dehydrogenase (short-subunit alcohol dehydrogenase family)